ncbi:MAG: Do family serine endopeptidase [Candidatus Omnitrophica bacterium]|nr:Do family serine endopeptidase [Candidatus Omnitrophota bacterium]
MVSERIKKFILASAVFTGGILCGLLIAMRLDLPVISVAENKPLPKISGEIKSLQDAYVRVAEDVGRAVVSISTEQTVGGPFGGGEGEDFFDDFFKQFFGETPRRVPRRQYKLQGRGSGVIIDPDGYILTNNHVVRDADKIAVTLSDGRELKAELKGKDSRSDLAVIKVKGKDLPFAILGDSDKVKTGQIAIAIGNPFGYLGSPEPTVTSGLISAIHRSMSIHGMGGESITYDDLIQTDAAINPGNSGGPLVNIDGEIIGINVAIATRTGGYEGVGFAIPVNSAKRIIDNLIAGKKVLYGWLGIQVKDVEDDIAEINGLPPSEGALIFDVIKDSPAEKAGFERYDIIRTINGETVKGARDVVTRVGRMDIGKKIKVGIIRNKTEKVIEVEIGERPEEIGEAGKAGETWRGIEVEEITQENAGRYGIEEETGVLIINIEPNTPADDTRLQVGDIINEIAWEKGVRSIKNIKDYQSAIKEAKGPVRIRTNRDYVILKEEVGK